MISYCHCLHAETGDLFEQSIDPNGPVKQAEFGVNVQVSKGGLVLFGGFILTFRRHICLTNLGKSDKLNFDLAAVSGHYNREN
jgi:hypothetical protein